MITTFEGYIQLFVFICRELQGSSYRTTKRGNINIKGKGKMSTYFLEAPDSAGHSTQSTQSAEFSDDTETLHEITESKFCVLM